jgi:putative transposase
MLRKKAFHFRIFPNQEQAVLISKTLGYKQTGKGLSYHACAVQRPLLKKELPWL